MTQPSEAARRVAEEWWLQWARHKSSDKAAINDLAEALDAFAAEAVAAERERCASLATQMAAGEDGPARLKAINIAAAIRKGA